MFVNRKPTGISSNLAIIVFNLVLNYVITTVISKTTAPLVTREVFPASAQEFADAVRSIQENENLVIRLAPGQVINMTDPGIVLRNLDPPTVQSGSLSVIGDPIDWAVVDFGSRNAFAVSVMPGIGVMCQLCQLAHASSTCVACFMRCVNCTFLHADSSGWDSKARACQPPPLRVLLQVLSDTSIMAAETQRAQQPACLLQVC